MGCFRGFQPAARLYLFSLSGIDKQEVLGRTNLPTFPTQVTAFRSFSPTVNNSSGCHSNIAAQMSFLPHCKLHALVASVC
jgi:hypothetical protein